MAANNKTQTFLPSLHSTSSVNPLLQHSSSSISITPAKQQQQTPVASNLSTPINQVTRPSSLVFVESSMPTLPGMYSVTPPGVSAANTGAVPTSLLRPPMNRMASLPDPGTSANFWQMLFDLRSRSLAKAKLKQSSQVSALLSGFALVAMVEMDVPANVPVPLLLIFIFTTTLLVSVHMIALMISTCILPHVESINCMEDRAASYGLVNLEEANYTQSNGTTPTPSNSKSPQSSIPSWSPYEKMSFYIDIAWTCSTVIGIFLFILELAFIVWVKFWGYAGGYYIAIASSIILLPVLISLIFFAFHFYQKLVTMRYEFTDKVLNELNMLADGLA